MAESALILIHTDGASRGNPGPAAFAYILQRDGEDPIEEAGRIGRMTNNQAEYTALVRALEHALELGADHRVLVHSDSELLVKQMRGEYRVKNEDLRDLYEQARGLSGRFRGGVTFRHVRREENSRADALGNEALDGLREPTPRASNTPRAVAARRETGGAVVARSGRGVSAAGGRRVGRGRRGADAGAGVGRACRPAEAARRLKRPSNLAAPFGNGRPAARKSPANALASGRGFCHKKPIPPGAPLAQLAEQLTLNQRVVGSSPTRGIKLRYSQLVAIGLNPLHRQGVGAVGFPLPSPLRSLSHSHARSLSRTQRRVHAGGNVDGAGRNSHRRRSPWRPRPRSLRAGPRARGTATHPRRLPGRAAGRGCRRSSSGGCRSAGPAPAPAWGERRCAAAG